MKLDENYSASEIYRLFNKGVVVQEIADRFSITRRTVFRHLKRARYTDKLIYKLKGAEHEYHKLNALLISAYHGFLNADPIMIIERMERLYIDCSRTTQLEAA